MVAAQARPFRTLRGVGGSLFAVKRSRFRGHAEPVRDEASVQEILAGIRAAHPDAGHHAFAFRIGSLGEVGRFSDDGEPGGTAGRPMMEVLLRDGLVDALVVVTRYFGGILLGSGGLTRAYGQAAADAIRAAGSVGMLPHTMLHVTVDYARWGALEQALRRTGLTAHDLRYAEHVRLTVPVPAGEAPAFAVLVADLTAGTGAVTTGEMVYLPEPTIEPPATPSTTA